MVRQKIEGCASLPPLQSIFTLCSGHKDSRFVPFSKLLPAFSEQSPSLCSIKSGVVGKAPAMDLARPECKSYAVLSK